jgi:spermidine/putrescine-binding protein
MRPRSAGPRSATRIHRRAFLRLSAALGAVSLIPARLTPAGGPIIASTFPLPFAHHFFPSPEALLERRLGAFDLLLVPAYAAAELIRRGALQSIPGVPGRAHDPEGAFTIPFFTAISALVYRGATPASLDDLWSRDALWPDSPRLVVGATLLRRGYPLNDTHPAHLAHVENDLLQLRPRLAPDPVAGVRSGLADRALALIPVHPNLTPHPRSRLLSGTADATTGEGEPEAEVKSFIPSEGAALIEYDWAIPLGARNAEAAQALIADTQYGIRHTQGREAPPWDASPSTLHREASPWDASRLTPLTPLPSRTLARRAAIWKRLKETQA